MKQKDWSGSRHERLLVLHKARSKDGKNGAWLCRCDCGKEVIVSTPCLLHGQKSCGCWKVDHPAHLIHNGKRLHKRAYKSWKEMRQRCSNPNSDSWKWYGSKGIQVCSRWNDFRLFYLDMGDPPIGTSIHRIDGDGNYEPTNCKWATAKEQASNNRGVFKKGNIPHNKGGAKKGRVAPSVL
jgi:hypothetical protein